MTKAGKYTTIKIFIASSTELKEERKNCILYLNQINKSYSHLRLEPVEWEYDIEHGSYADFAAIQPAINSLLNPCKVCIFLFNSKIGKFTRQEFELAQKSKKKIFPFFKKGFSPETDIEFSNWKELIDFKKGMNETILYEEYKSNEDFEVKLKDNLNLFLSRTYSSRFIGETKSLSREGFEIKNTNEIILASQPLTSLDLLLTIESSDTELKAKIKQGNEEFLENAMDSQGGMPPVPFELQNFQSQLVPIIEYLGNLNNNLTTNIDSNFPYGFVVLIALDNSYNSILSFGDFSNADAWTSESSKLLISGGFINDHFFITGRQSYPQSANSLKDKGRSSYSISWNLDPKTMKNSIDRKVDSIIATARLPKVMELVVLSNIKHLPFAKNDFSQTDAINLWKTGVSDGYAFQKNKTFDASLKIIVNGISEMAYDYELKNIIGEELFSEYEDIFELRCTKFIFERS